MDADGSNIRRLTREDGADGSSAWSPDGRTPRSESRSRRDLTSSFSRKWRFKCASDGYPPHFELRVRLRGTHPSQNFRFFRPLFVSRTNLRGLAFQRRGKPGARIPDTFAAHLTLCDHESPCRLTAQTLGEFYKWLRTADTDEKL